MIRQLEQATARIEEANAALDELIFALHRRLQVCRAQRAKAKKLDDQRRQPVPVGAPPNLWWVGGEIPLSFWLPISGFYVPGPATTLEKGTSRPLGSGG